MLLGAPRRGADRQVVAHGVLYEDTLGHSGTEKKHWKSTRASLCLSRTRSAPQHSNAHSTPDRIISSITVLNNIIRQHPCRHRSHVVWACRVLRQAHFPARSIKSARLIPELNLLPRSIGL